MFVLYKPLLFIHIFFGFLYMLSHGASATVAYRLRHESGLERVRALLDLSRSSFTLMYLALLAMLLGGIALGFLGHFWSSGWIWASLVLLVVILVAMKSHSIAALPSSSESCGFALPRRHQGAPSGRPRFARRAPPASTVRKPAPDDAHWHRWMGRHSLAYDLQAFLARDVSQDSGLTTRWSPLRFAPGIFDRSRPAQCLVSARY